MKSENRNILYIEVIRVVAAFFVIFNHSGSEGFTMFMKYPPDSFQHWFYLSVSALTKINVPLFFMISGALLLKKTEEPFKKQLYRFIRILLALLIFSLLVYIVDVVQSGDPFQIKYFFENLIEDTVVISYWFMYLYLAFLLTLPFLRRLAHAMKEKEFQYMILLVILITGLIPIAGELILGRSFGLSPYFSISWIAARIVFYPLMGYYAANVLDLKKVSGKFLAVIWAAAAVCIGLTCIMTSRYSVAAGVIDETYLNHLVAVSVLAVFLSFRKLFTLHPVKGKAAAFIQTVGSCTFGIYLIHVFFILLPKISLVHLFMESLPQIPLICGFLRTLEIMAASFVLTWILKKIPGVRKLL